MSLKERLERQLVSSRQMTERMLQDFKTPEDWVFQVHPNCNHALWFAGHMANTDNFLLSLVAPEKSKSLPDSTAKFGMGSRPTNRTADYPEPEQVLSTMRERRAALLEVLHSMSEEDLAKKTPSGTPEFLPDYASVFELAIWHEGIHGGQLSVARRALGHKPLMDAATA